ncbi:hypothetical protein [uncultured Sphingomonas sp.]|uniref:hypothetical protein n=1 Tax=uncultured Sphingomonas sp. TaxID=158754 RepID=UPI0025E6B13D|nr:hypothetical protein [uncultured Sphingomonas sp.]
MRKERQALVARVEDELHAVEAAMHELQVKYARLHVSILEVRQAARLSPLIATDALSSHANGSGALATFAGHINECHLQLRETGLTWFPETNIGATPAIPRVATPKPQLAAVA